MSATTQRDQAIHFAPSNPDKALVLARKVSDPWFRCQALAWVARFAPEKEVMKIAREAFKSASEGKDAYQRVAVAAWPLHALVERGEGKVAEGCLLSLLKESRNIEPATSRMAALFLLFQALYPQPKSTWQKVLAEIKSVSQSEMSKKAGGILCDVAIMLASVDKEEADRVVKVIPEGTYKRQAERRLTEGETLEPRSFFWNSP